MRTIKATVYSIRFSNIENDFSVFMSAMNNKLFTDLGKVRDLLEEHGYEELANRGTEPDVIARFVNLKYTYSLKESYFNAPRAEIVKDELEVVVDD